MTPVERVLLKLRGAKRTARGWIAHCPGHDNRQPSLTIAEGNEGRVLLHGHAGCTTEAIVVALGLTVLDLMPQGGC